MIMRIILQLVDLFNYRERIEILGLIILVLTGSILDILGIGLILPLILAISNHQVLLDNQLMGPILKHMNLTERNELLVLFSCTVIVIFVVKNGYLAIQYRIVYGFLFNKMVLISTRMLDGYMKAPYTFHMQHNSAYLIRNTNSEVQRLFQGIVQPTVILLTDILLTIGIMLLLFLVQPYATLGALFVLGIASIGLNLLVRKRLTKAGGIRSERQGKMIQWVNDGLMGIKEIRVLGRESHFVSGFQKSTKDFGDALRENQLNLQYPRLTIETAAAIGGIALFLALYLPSGDFIDSVPVFSLFAVALVRLMPTFTRINTAVNSIRFSAPSVKIVHGQLAETSELLKNVSINNTKAEILLRKNIAIKEMSFNYPGSDQLTINNANLNISAFDSVAFVGASGAGKTTLANLILGLLEPSSGSILVDNLNIHENISSWQKQIGYIPQDIYLTNDTLLKNVAFGIPEKDIDDGLVWQALEAAQIAHFVRGLDSTVKSIIGDRGLRLSGGERQRIGIARALYHSPQILILDEATSSLDYETESYVMNAIYQVAKSKTVIIISHRISTVKKCDSIYFLESGKITGSGTFDELLTGSEGFRDLVRAGELSLN